MINAYFLFTGILITSTGIFNKNPTGTGILEKFLVGNGIVTPPSRPSKLIVLVSMLYTVCRTLRCISVFCLLL